MGPMTKSQLLASEFDHFDVLAARLEASAKSREQNADELVRDMENPMGSGEWTGAAGRAAQGRGDVIAGSMKKKCAIEEQAAHALRQAGSSLQSHKEAVVAMLDAIEQVRPFVISYRETHKSFGHATVNEDWKVVPPPVRIPDAPPDDVRAVVDELVRIDQDDLDAKLRAFIDEDAAQARRIDEATDFAEVAKSDDPLVGVTPDRARQAVEHVLDGTATEEEKAIVEKGTQLRGDELAALGSDPKGMVDVGPERWGTIYQIGRALDGKSTAEIAAAVSKLDPEAKKAVQRALALGSDPNVGSGAPQSRPDAPLKDVRPQKGGKDALPSGVRAALGRGDRIGYQGQLVGEAGNPPWIPDTRSTTAFLQEKGVGELQDLADIMRGTPDSYMKGNDLDKGVMSAFAQYLHAENNPDMSQMRGELGTPVSHYGGARGDGRGENPLGDVVSVFGQDQAVGHDMIAGADGRSRNDAYIKDLLVHAWPDGGKSVRESVLAWEADQAHVGQDATPEQAAQATRAGQAMRALDDFMIAHHDELEKIDWHPGTDMWPGADPKPLGALNPELLRGLAEANAPYMANLVGAPEQDTHTLGFGSLDAKNGFPDQKKLFALMDADAGAAAIFNGSAYATAAALEQLYGKSLLDGDPAAHYLEHAGQLHGLVDKGLDLALDNENRADDKKNSEAYELKSKAYDWLKENGPKVLKHIPVLGTLQAYVKDVMELAGTGKEDIIGKKPEPGHAPEPYRRSITDTDMTAQICRVAEGVANANHGRLPEFPAIDRLRAADMLAGAGQLKPYAEIVGLAPDGSYDADRAALLNEYLRKYLESAFYEGKSTGTSFTDGMQVYDQGARAIR